MRGRGRSTCTARAVVCVHYIITMSSELRSMCKSGNLLYFLVEKVSNFPRVCIQLIISSFPPQETIDAVLFPRMHPYMHHTHNVIYDVLHVPL